MTSDYLRAQAFWDAMCPVEDDDDPDDGDWAGFESSQEDHEMMLDLSGQERNEWLLTAEERFNTLMRDFDPEGCRR